MNTHLKMLGVVAVILSPSAALAVDANVPFSGSVSSTCTIVVNSNGTIAPNATATVLGSKLAGGAAGQATITTNDASFNVSVANPTDFSGPAVFTGTPTFLSEYALSGATGGSGDHTAATSLALGVTNVDVDMTATLASGVYNTGSYSGTVVLTCS